MQNIDTYLSVTAITAAGLPAHAAAFADLSAALKTAHLNPIKLALETSIQAIAHNHMFTDLLMKQQELIKLESDLTLALHEVKNSPAKNMTEEQFNDRQQHVAELLAKLEDIKSQLNQIQDALKELRAKSASEVQGFQKTMMEYLKKLADLNHQKVDIVDNYLKNLQLKTDPAVLKKELFKLFNSPAILEKYMILASQGTKSFSQKIGDLFKSGKVDVESIINDEVKAIAQLVVILTGGDGDDRKVIAATEKTLQGLKAKLME